MSRFSLAVQDVLLTEYEKGYRRVVCPRCMGGSTKEKCMTLYEGDDGVPLCTCHRAHCNVGTQPIGRLADVRDRPKSKRTPPTLAITYTSSSKMTSKYLYDNYAYPFMPTAAPFIRETEEKRPALIFPMRGPDHTEEGYIVKPLAPGTGPKSLTYKDRAEYSGMSWYMLNTMATDYVYVVEDVLSAIALHIHTGAAAVSLNGTMLNRQRLDELLEYKWKIILMLDADATSKAIKYSLQYGPDVVRVVRLTKDIKNMTAEEVNLLMEAEGI